MADSSLLDLDLDFFLNAIAHYKTSNKRLSNRDFKAWTKNQVREFLEARCGLSRQIRIPGRICREHHEVWTYWTELREKGLLAFPFELVHVDAHADFGLGGPSWKHILTKVLSLPPDKREAESVGHLNEGNFLAYAAACRWISKCSYVHHPAGGRDMHPYFWQDLKNRRGDLQLRAFDDAELDRKHGAVEDCTPLAVTEPPIPFNLICGSKWQASGRFSFASLAQSPRYTPKSSDSLIPVFAEFIDFEP